MDALTSWNIYGFNIVDFLFIFVLIYFTFTNRGFIETLLDIIGFILALVVGYRLYTWVGNLYIHYFSLPSGIANAVGFFTAWFVFESIIFTFISFFILRLLGKIRLHPLNLYGGYLTGALHGLLIFLFFISLVFSFPTRGQIKQAILDSRTGPFFVNASQNFEFGIKKVFGGAVSEAVNFLTVKPEAGSTLDLGFKLKASQLSPDPESEVTMLSLINKERTSRGLNALKFDYELRPVARAYGEEMMTHGFFSHTSQVDGSDPGQRATRAGIDFTVLGENLAYAPDVYIAHQGLMNSPGHRANILSPDYNRVGIGVLDGGIYDRIFVQEFRN